MEDQQAAVQQTHQMLRQLRQEMQQQVPGAAAEQAEALRRMEGKLSALEGSVLSAGKGDVRSKVVVICGGLPRCKSYPHLTCPSSKGVQSPHLLGMTFSCPTVVPAESGRSVNKGQDRNLTPVLFP